MRGKLLSLMLSVFLAFNAMSQTIDLEKTYQITGKAKRGTLANVEFNAETGYTLVYTTKSTERKAKFQTYYFDKDFNFIKMDESELEFEKARVKYKWFKVKEESYSVTGISVEPNLVGTLVLKKKKVTFTFDWDDFCYKKTVELLEKVKPKTDDGKKLFYYKHTEDDVTGEVIILCGTKEKLTKDADPFLHQKDMYILKYNANLDLVKETNYKFDYPQNVIFGRMLLEESPDYEVAGLVILFAPAGGQGYKDKSDPDMTNYTYMKIDKDCQIVEDVKFKSPASFWKIEEMILAGKDLYFFGPSAEGKDKYYNTLTATTKFKAVQLMKVSDKKVDYITSTNLDEFEAKLKTPPSQKKAPAYAGKKFEIANYGVAVNGDFFVFGQNFSSGSEGNKYEDVLSFHFDSKGVLKSQYGVDTKESGKDAKAKGCPQFTIEKDKNNMYWCLREIKGSTSAGKMLTYPRIGKIDTESGTIADFADFGRESGYFLDNSFPYLETDKGNTLVFFGSDKGGKTIWFLRVKL
ncbi:MAG: hypothetical protein KKA07_06420 [Bacteroidetes bacterium]|nr:hypothetical protein [Bacteroidota bacterium]MBU1718690.1 hypothetical protein [Bacteroidota bacterium]